MKSHRKGQKGQGLAEYGLILSGMAVVVVAVMALVGTGVRQTFCSALIGVNVEMAADCLPEPDLSSPEEEGEEGNTEIRALSAMSPASGELIVIAKVPRGSLVSLSLMGYGNMQRLGESNVFVYRAPVTETPETVTIIASDGSTLTVKVRAK